MDYLEHYADSKPDIRALQTCYERHNTDLSHYYDQCRASYDDRRCYWDGKANDLRKHGADAFPWDGASDMEVPLINEKVSTYVALCTAALKRANIRAYPVESGDAARSRLVSSFLKWMVKVNIDRFEQEMEANANFLFDKGIMVTYTGWQQEDRTFNQELDLNEIAEYAPQVAEAIIGGQDDDAIIDLFRAEFPALVQKRAKKALKELRKNGVATLPISKRSVDAPFVKAVQADGDVIFPPSTLDPQKAPQVFYRVFLTPQDLNQKVVADGWDSEWVDYVVEHKRGVRFDSTNHKQSSRTTSLSLMGGQSQNDLIEVVYAYQRLIDREDGSEGIYCTVMHPEWSGDEHDPKYAKHELLNGLEDYPFVVTRLTEESQQLYDVQTFSDYLRGIQWQVKVERDQRADKASLSTLPPIMHPASRPPQDWGPGRYVPYMRPGELHFGPVPQYTADSAQIENVLIEQADSLIGLNLTSPLSPIRQQFYVDKFLSHVRDVLRATWKNYQRYGPDEQFFRVTGMTEQMQMTKGNPEENFDIIVSFDTQNTDPDSVEKRLMQMVNLLSLDRNGKMDIDRLIELAASTIDPILADSILRPTEVAQEQVVRQVTDDLTKVFSGIEVPARPQGAEIALGLVQQYAQQPDIAERLQGDEAFAERLNKYAQQYQFQLQQVQNAQTGRVGTTPAQMGGAQTQGINMG